MEGAELTSHLSFVRECIKNMDEMIHTLDGGNWNRNVRGDYDKEMIYSQYTSIRSEFNSLLRREYDCEK